MPRQVGEEPGAAASSARVLRRRRGLPGGRAVVGGFLVAASAVGVFAAYLEATGPPERSWIVATAPVSIGEAIEPRHLGLVALDLPPQLHERAFTDPADVVGAVATAPIAPNDLLLATHVVAADAGGHDALSFAIDRSRAVAGRVSAGDRIDVLASFGPSDPTTVVAQDVLVLDVRSSDQGIAGREQFVLTVAIDTEVDPVTLTHAAEHGGLRLVRLSPTRGADR